MYGLYVMYCVKLSATDTTDTEAALCHVRFKKRRERFASAGFHLTETTSDVSHLLKWIWREVCSLCTGGTKVNLTGRLGHVHKREGNMIMCGMTVALVT